MKNCPDCGTMPGQLHTIGCDVERCPECGFQYITCICADADDNYRLPWTGEWPGLAECREFGWYSKLVPSQGWVQCDRKDAGASPDLNRLYAEAIWDKKQRRFVLPAKIPPGWYIEYNPKPIPDRRFDYDFWHDDYDGTNDLHGNAASIEDAISEIHELEKK